MRTQKTEGIIIKRRNFGEADRILTVFTKNHGKIQVKALGIRRIPSRRSAHVELLNYAVLTLHKGRNMDILTEAHSIESYQNIKCDLRKIGIVYHLCELIDGLCPENQENNDVFNLLKNSLDKISSSSHSERNDLPANAPPETLRVSMRTGLHRQLQAGESYATGPTTGLSVHDKTGVNSVNGFEMELLNLLGFWNRSENYAYNFNTRSFIENILEHRLKSRDIFSKMQ